VTTLLRTEAVAAIARHRGRAITLPTMQAVDPWNALGQADSRNFGVTGCMGAAASVALGLAIACPREKIVVIDGDGSLMMQLGSLVSVAKAAATNIVHIVMENGVYETSGSQRVPGHRVSDLGKIALACGYASAYRLRSVEEIDDRLPDILREIGPILVSLEITGPGIIDNPIHPRDLPLKPAQVQRLRTELATSA
jgi:sulfopyruvate decarboxylase subunit beta